MANVKRNIIEPTRSELEILQVLWLNGPSTVRFVNDKLNEQKREVNYTSTLKLMQIMVEKGILKRDGSASSLMMQLLGNKKTSKKELEKIRQLIEQFNINNK